MPVVVEEGLNLWYGRLNRLVYLLFTVQTRQAPHLNPLLSTQYPVSAVCVLVELLNIRLHNITLLDILPFYFTVIKFMSVYLIFPNLFSCAGGDMGDFGKDKELVSQLKVILVSFSFLQSMWLEFSTSLISLWSFVRIVRRDQVNRTCKNFVYSITQNNKIVRLSNMADTFFEKSMRCTKVVFCFSCLCFLDAEWLNRQSPITWMGVVHVCGNREQAAP